jgi:hypothetical protein
MHQYGSRTKRRPSAFFPHFRLTANCWAIAALFRSKRPLILLCSYNRGKASQAAEDNPMIRRNRIQQCRLTEVTVGKTKANDRSSGIGMFPAKLSKR